VQVISCLFTTVRASDKRIACDEEFSDSEDEGEGGGRRHQDNLKSKRIKLEEKTTAADKDKCKSWLTGFTNI